MTGRREIEEAAREKFGEPNKRLSTRRELRFGRKGSVAVCVDGARAGLWFDHEAQSGGRLGRQDGDGGEYSRPASRPPVWNSNSEAQFRREIDSSHSIRPGELVRERPEEPLPRRDGESAIYRLPDGSVRRFSLHDECSLYLQRRGIDRWPDHSVRQSYTGVCYIARSFDGTPMAVQVVPVIAIKQGTTLRPDAGTKNHLYWLDGVTKRTYTLRQNWQDYAAVHLPGRGGIILCEGVENGLSIWLATGRHVACCLGMSGLKWLRCGKRVTIATDGDKPGSQAARFISAAIDERKSRGATVKIAAPPVGTDFNDLHCRFGLRAVADIINQAKAA